MFDVDPKQVQALEAKELVVLLRRLLHAEAQVAGVPLGAVSVPLQITVPDGGEDGRISWIGGKDFTDYLPGRTIFFQCKASKIARSGWKKECWDKSTHGKDKEGRNKERKLAPALISLIDQGGCYVGFTTEALTGERRDDYVAAIKEAIIEAKGDPGKLHKIELYDANHIADWARQHPAVALWLSEKASGHSLSGFQTIDAWGSRPDFSSPYADDGDERYLIGSAKERDRTGSNSTSASVAWERIVEHIGEPGRLVRVVGTSGLGKSRFVYESLKSAVSPLATSIYATAVFADYRVVPTTLLQVASELAESKKRILLVVDECPRDVAIDLAKQAARSGSLLSVITIDTDDRAWDGTTLQVSLLPGGVDLVDRIIRAANPSLADSTVRRLRELCGGFPRFAILAAKSLDGGRSIFETADDVIDRILMGSHIREPEEVRAIQCLSLFDSLSIEATSPVELDVVATKLGRMQGDAMYEHLTKAQAVDIVGRKRDRISAQPLPMAVNLASRRAALMRPDLLFRFVNEASDDLALSLLRRCRYLDKSPTVIEVAMRLLRDEDMLGRLAGILTARGAAILNALVHIVPDRVAEHLDHFILPLDDAELVKITAARRSLVHAAARLAFRHRSFATGARLLLRLGANESDPSSDNATALFKQLFQLYVSGTEVSPEDRFVILDEGLGSAHAPTVALCVDALASIFSSDVMRFGDYDETGSGDPLQDWQPKIYDDIYSFFREGLKRLAAIRKTHDAFAERCEHIIASAARRLLGSNVGVEYGELLASIAQEKGGWPDAVETVGDWLYFDRPDTTSERSVYVRQLYDRLFPANLIDRAIVFTKFWQSDIRDPDLRYAEDKQPDYEYSERASREVARALSDNAVLATEAIERMTAMDLKTVYSFADELGQRALNREELFNTALEAVAASPGGAQMLRGLLHGIDLVDHAMADRCITVASQHLDPSKHPLINLHAALELKDRARIEAAVAQLESGRIAAADFVYLSYGRGLDALPSEDLAILLRALRSHGGDGVWAALEVAMMYRYGEPAPAAHAREIAALLVAPDLLEHAGDRQRDSHIFESLINRVQTSLGISDDLADGLSRQLVRLVQSKDYNLIDTLIGGMRHLVEVLVTSSPQVIWDHAARLFQVATPIERSRLRKIIGPNRSNFERANRNGQGSLFGVPENLIHEWADEAADRLPLLVDFYPILTPTDRGGLNWHPAFEELASRYGGEDSFRNALAQRMRPSSWSGSIVPLLEVYLAPLQNWFNHPVIGLARWAKDMHRNLESRIERGDQWDLAEQA